jgi:hypothetical protein
MKSLIRSFPLAVLTLLVACSDSTPAPAGKPACEAIYERCHPLDQGTGDIHECHEFAEAAATTNDQCVARRAACFTACTATDAGSDASTGSDASADAATNTDASARSDAADASGG